MAFGVHLALMTKRLASYIFISSFSLPSTGKPLEANLCLYNLSNPSKIAAVPSMFHGRLLTFLPLTPVYPIRY